jgi:hypothetical protein
VPGASRPIGVNLAAAIAGEGAPADRRLSLRERASLLACPCGIGSRRRLTRVRPRLRVLSRSERRRNAAPYTAAPPPDRTHFVGRSRVSHAQLTPMVGQGRAGIGPAGRGGRRQSPAIGPGMRGDAPPRRRTAPRDRSRGGSRAAHRRDAIAPFRPAGGRHTGHLARPPRRGRASPG